MAFVAADTGALYSQWSSRKLFDSPRRVRSRVNAAPVFQPIVPQKNAGSLYSNVNTNVLKITPAARRPRSRHILQVFQPAIPQSTAGKLCRMQNDMIQEVIPPPRRPRSRHIAQVFQPAVPASKAGSLYNLKTDRGLIEPPPHKKKSAVILPTPGAFPSRFDSLRFYGSGAASDGGAQGNNLLNLGGFRSGSEWGSIYAFGAADKLTIQRIGEGNAPGISSVEHDGTGRYRFTAPGSSTPGPYVAIGDQQTVILEDGVSPGSALRVFRSGTTPQQVARKIKLVQIYNNAFAMDNVTNTQRLAGQDKYRAFILKNMSLGAITLKLYLGNLGTPRTVDVAGYAASGAITLPIAALANTPDDFPATGYVCNSMTGEVMYYSSRTTGATPQLTIAASGRDIYSEVGGGAAGHNGDAIYPIPGFRIATETPGSQPSGSIQQITNDSTAPTGRSWVHPVNAADANTISVTLASGNIVGLWVHRKVIAGATAAATVDNQIIVNHTDARGVQFGHTLRGRYRMADATLARYELYRGVDAQPDFTQAAWQTFTTFPFTTPSLAAGHTYNFVLRLRNIHNLASQNVAAWSVVVDASGNIVNAPSAPSSQNIAAAANGAATITAKYDYRLDGQYAADTWVVWFTNTGTPPNPATDAPAFTQTMKKTAGQASLSWLTGANANGALLQAIVRTRRSGTPNVNSTNTAIMSVVAIAAGPAQPVNAGSFLGEAALATAPGMIPGAAANAALPHGKHPSLSAPTRKPRSSVSPQVKYP